MLKQTNLLLVFASMMAPVQAWGQAQDVLVESTTALNFSYSQQEHGTLHFDLLAPQMGNWGRLGVNFGSSNYYGLDASGKAKLNTASQVAAVWYLEGSLFSLENSAMTQKMGMSTSLRLGMMQYDSLVNNEEKAESFTFFEVETLYKISSFDKGAPNDKWIKGSSFGIGAGFRSNFISRPEAIGSSAVDPLRVFPTIQLSLYLF